MSDNRSTIEEAEAQGFRFNPDQMTAEEENAAQIRQALAEAAKDAQDVKVYKAKPETKAEKAKADKAMREGSENEANAMKGYKKGGSVKKSSDKKWIGKAIKKPGALRESLGVKKGEKIPAKKLAAAAKKPGKMGQRARLAQTLKGFKEGGHVRGGGCESRGKTRCKFI